MTINNPINPAQVWLTAPRTLTGLGGAAVLGGGVDQQNLANGSVAGFGTPGQMGVITIVGLGTPSVTWNFGIVASDFTFKLGNLGSTAHANMIQGSFTSNRGLGVQNAGSVAGPYSVVLVAFVQ